MKEGEQYISGVIDAGIFGKLDILVFQNKDKKTGKSPDVFIVRKLVNGELKRAGAGWIKTKKTPHDENRVSTLKAHREGFLNG